MLRGALAAILMAVALPAATVAVTTIASPAVAQTASSIVVEGNRRVEAETIRTYFKPGPGGRIDSGSINDGLAGAVRDRPVPGRAHQPGRWPTGRHRHRKSGDQPRHFRRQQEGQGRAARDRSAVEAARQPVATDRAVRHAAHHRNLPPPGPLRRDASFRRSSSSPTTASISSSRSPKAARPASGRSNSSATARFRRIACATSSRPAKPTS